MAGPATSAGGPFTADELETLFSVFDTLIPSISASELLQAAPNAAYAGDKAVAAFAEDSPSRNDRFRKIVTETLPANVPPKKLAELKGVLQILRGPVGALLFASSLTPFHQHPRAVREQILLSWKTSRLGIYRKLYDSLTMMCFNVFLRSSTAAHAVMGYNPKPTSPPEEGHFQYNFLDPKKDLDNLQVDAVIIGSGAGGGVTAKMLAEAGMRVLVVEKGQHIDHSRETPLTEAEAFENMYDSAGFSSTIAGNVAVIQGSVFGGGTAVNWAASLQTSASVRKDWASNAGIPYFTSAEFQEDLDSVCEYMGVSPPPTQSTANTHLLEGARRLGYSAAAVPQNTGPEHACHHDCANGCRSGHKKGSAHSWLVDASKAGAVFLQKAYARRIVFTSDGTYTPTGVILRFSDGTEKQLSAPRIIVSAGSVHTPALLLRSKIPNYNIGQSLYLHPTNYVHAVFPTPTIPYTGNILTSVVSEFANLTPSGHGVRIETGCMQPAVGMSLLQWHGGKQHKAAYSKYNNTAGIIAISRDRDPGRVLVDDTTGEPAIDYSVSAFDARSVVVGVLAAADCMRAAGATEIHVGARGVEPWKPYGAPGEEGIEGERRYEAWKRRVEAATPACYGSAHQMGSCRMSCRESEGATDSWGRVYGTGRKDGGGVWCADASVLPSASGVNPMVSTMAVARRVARGIVAQWEKGRKN